MILKDKIKTTFEEFNILVNERQLEMFEKFSQMLIETNKQMNLTSIIEPNQIIEKHFLDILLITKEFDFLKNKNLYCIDVGSGAGFPGIPISIYYSNLNFVLNESSIKKSFFLKKVCQKLKLNSKILTMRSENASNLKEYREKFDFCTSRAVANLNILLELCIPFLKIGGFFAAYKSLNFKKELEIINKNKKASILGAELFDIKKTFLPSGNDFRAILIFKKVKRTPKFYPRQYSIIKKED